MPLHGADAPPDEVAHAVTRALTTAGASSRPVLVDFDHTLLASNSTELFLSTVKPAFLASCVLALLRGAIPWRLVPRGHHRLRDYVVVRGMCLLMPWSLRAWRQQAPALFERHLARSVAGPLAQVPAERITIVSFGIEPILRGLLKGSRWEACRLVCTPLPCSARLLSRGKVAQLAAAMPPIAIDNAVFVTDSEDDRDLLDQAGVPLLIARQGPLLVAETRLYFPLRYAAMAKFDEQYVKDQLFGVDLVLALVCTQAAWSGSVALALGAVLLHLSFQTIYEIGYFENDFLSASKEKSPTLRDARHLFVGVPLERNAWVWGSALGLAGCVAVHESAITGATLPALLALWAATLLVSRGLFGLYNRQPEGQRILLYPFLQAAKYFGVLVCIPGFALGLALLSAQVTMMWMNYLIYRLGGSKAGFPREWVRLVAFGVFGIACVFASPAPAEWGFGGPMAVGALFAWCVWRTQRLKARAALKGFLKRRWAVRTQRVPPV